VRSRHQVTLEPAGSLEHRLQARVVPAGGRAHEHPGDRAGSVPGSTPTRSRGLQQGLEQHPLLRVQGKRSAGDGEETGGEIARVVDEPPRARTRPSCSGRGSTAGRYPTRRFGEPVIASPPLARSCQLLRARNRGERQLSAHDRDRLTVAQGRTGTEYRRPAPRRRAVLRAVPAAPPAVGCQQQGWRASRRPGHRVQDCALKASQRVEVPGR